MVVSDNTNQFEKLGQPLEKKLETASTKTGKNLATKVMKNPGGAKKSIAKLVLRQYQEISFIFHSR